LPAAINNFLPAGISGIVLTSLLGAFMGTFSGALNAARAYIINDIYLKFINPNAPTKRVIAMNYLVGALIVATSICLGFFVKNINSVLQWIANALYGGYIAANVLKRIWWRFNANGFFWGMASGIAAALILPYCKEWFPGAFFQLDLYNWPLLFFHFAHRLYCRHVYRTACSNKHIKVFLYNSSPLGILATGLSVDQD
jgi:Na+/proline symporter